MTEELRVNGRPTEDLLERVVRVRLAGRSYALPVRSIKFNREWKAQLDQRTAATVQALTEAGDDVQQVLETLAGDVEPFIDLLASYAPDVLTRDLIESLEPDPSLDVVSACREVWLAASPLVGIGLAAVTEMLTSESGGSQPTSSPLSSTGGAPSTSTPDSATNNSPPTSTLPPTGSPGATRLTSTPGSQRSGRARSSPTTSARSRGTAAAVTGAKGSSKGSRARRSSRP